MGNTLVLIDGWIVGREGQGLLEPCERVLCVAGEGESQTQIG